MLFPKKRVLAEKNGLNHKRFWRIEQGMHTIVGHLLFHVVFRWRSATTINRIINRGSDVV